MFTESISKRMQERLLHGEYIFNNLIIIYCSCPSSRVEIDTYTVRLSLHLYLIEVYEFYIWDSALDCRTYHTSEQLTQLITVQ